MSFTKDVFISILAGILSSQTALAARTPDSPQLRDDEIVRAAALLKRLEKRGLIRVNRATGTIEIRSSVYEILKEADNVEQSPVGPDDVVAGGCHSTGGSGGG